jgi:hypothetical protein
VTYADEQAAFGTLGQRADADIAQREATIADLTTRFAAAQLDADQARDALLAATADDAADDAALAALRDQVATLTARVSEVGTLLTAAQAAQAQAEGNLATANLTITQRDALIASLQAQLAAYTSPVPAGFKTLSTFPGATWVDKLAAASGDVYVPAADVTDIDAAWTDTRRQLVVVAKAVTRLRFEPGATLRIRPMTSTYWTKAKIAALATTPITIFQQTGGQLIECTGLTIVGTDQGHHYHGWSFFNCYNLKLVDLTPIGCNEGYGGAPPDETFGGTVRGAVDCHVRLRGASGQYPDGSNGSAVGFTFQQCLRCTVEASDVSHWRASSIVFYQSAGCGIVDTKLARDLTAGTGFGSGCHLNLEQTTGTFLRNVEFVGGVPGSDVTISMAGETASLDNATVILDDCKGGAAWPGSTKDGLVTFRYWGQDVTKKDASGNLVLTSDFAAGGRYASLGVTLANVDAKGYSKFSGRHVAYDGKPAGVKRSGVVRQNGVVVSSFTSAYGLTMVGPGGQPIPST